MRQSVPQWLVPLAILCFVLLGYFAKQKKPTADYTEAPSLASSAGTDPSRLLVRPFRAGDGQVALALDGGELPILGGEVPHLVWGKNHLRTLHLVWIHDWTDANCRTTLQKLQSLYESEEADALPALKLHLAPVFSHPQGEAVHRAMLQVKSRARTRDLYQTLAQEISNGSLAVDPDAIRNRCEEIEPELLVDWETPLEWLQSDMEKVFAMAQAQFARNSAVMGQDHVNQLTSMIAVLPPTAGQQEMIDFLQQANQGQRLWLLELPLPLPGMPVVTCTCTDPAHVHASAMARSMQLRTVPAEGALSAPSTDPDSP